MVSNQSSQSHSRIDVLLQEIVSSVASVGLILSCPGCLRLPWQGVARVKAETDRLHDCIRANDGAEELET